MAPPEIPTRWERTRFPLTGRDVLPDNVRTVSRLGFRRLVPALSLALALPWAAAVVTAVHELVEHGHGHEPIAGLLALTHGHEHDADTPDHGHEGMTATREVAGSPATMSGLLSCPVEVDRSCSARAFPDRWDRPLDLLLRPLPGDLLRI
jgi:hypothetical protein